MYLLEPKKTIILKDNHGQISLKRPDGRFFRDIHFILLFPFTHLENYVSAVIKKGIDYEEVGIIKELKKFDMKTRKIIKDDLLLRYFVPEILEINDITTKYWFHIMDVVTDRGPKKIFMGNVRENIRFKSDNSIVITDMEKCRYKISKFEKLSKKSRTELEGILM